MLRRVVLVPALAGALLLLAAGVAGAHSGSPPAVGPMLVAPVAAPAPLHVTAASPSSGASLWPWLALLGLVPALAGRRASRLLATALALVVLFFAAESAVHSVHHGFVEKRAAVCPVTAAAAHLAGTDVETVAVDRPAPAPEPALEQATPLAVTLRQLGPHQGRAPPSALA